MTKKITLRSTLPWNGLEEHNRDTVLVIASIPNPPVVLIEHKGTGAIWPYTTQSARDAGLMT